MEKLCKNCNQLLAMRPFNVCEWCYMEEMRIGLIWTDEGIIAMG